MCVFVLLSSSFNGDCFPCPISSLHFEHAQAMDLTRLTIANTSQPNTNGISKPIIFDFVNFFLIEFFKLNLLATISKTIGIKKSTSAKKKQTIDAKKLWIKQVVNILPPEKTMTKTRKSMDRPWILRFFGLPFDNGLSLRPTIFLTLLMKLSLPSGRPRFV